jgi:hypothetical protein
VVLILRLWWCSASRWPGRTFAAFMHAARLHVHGLHMHCWVASHTACVVPARAVIVLQILLGRSEKRQLGSRKGNTFSIAHFGDGGGELEPEQEEATAADAAAAEVAAKDAKTFWAELLPEAAAEHAARAGRKEPEVRDHSW